MNTRETFKAVIDAYLDTLDDHTATDSGSTERADARGELLPFLDWLYPVPTIKLPVRRVEDFTVLDSNDSFVATAPSTEAADLLVATLNKAQP